MRIEIQKSAQRLPFSPKSIHKNAGGKTVRSFHEKSRIMLNRRSEAGYIDFDMINILKVFFSFAGSVMSTWLIGLGFCERKRAPLVIGLGIGTFMVSVLATAKNYLILGGIGASIGFVIAGVMATAIAKERKAGASLKKNTPAQRTSPAN